MASFSAGTQRGRHRAIAGVMGAGLTGVLVWQAPETVARVSAVFDPSSPGWPSLDLTRVLLLFAVMPATVVAVFAFLILPGAMLVRRLAPPATLAELALLSFVTSFVLHSASFSLVKLLSAGPVSPDQFRLALVADLGLGMLAWRRGAPWLSGDIDEAALMRRRLTWAVVLGCATVTLLLPMMFWQDFNPDGLEAFTTARSLHSHLLPRLPTGEAPGLGLGMVASAYPVHWLIALVGVPEPAARLMIGLYVPLLFLTMAALAESGQPRRMEGREEALLALALVAVGATLTFNDTYHPYSADLASPAGIDLLAMVALIGMLYAFWLGRPGLMAVLVVLGYLTRPTPLLILGLLGLAVLVVGPDRRRRLPMVLMGIVLCLAVAVMYEGVFAARHGIVLAEPSAGITGRRLRYLSFWEWSRWLYFIVPGGIVPILTFLSWRRLDHLGRWLLLVASGYFAFFYIPSFIALHHYAPAMLLPIVAMWRLEVGAPARTSRQALIAAGGVAALVLALPHSMTVDRSMRSLGRKTAYLVGRYDDVGYEGYRAAYASKELLDSLFPSFCADSEPQRIRESAAWVQVHYANRHGPVGPGVNYLVIGVADTAPAGFGLVAKDSGAALYVRDRAAWERDRLRPPRTDFRSPVYAIPLAQELPCLGIPQHRYTVDLKELLRLVPHGAKDTTR
jgi:hypothetical protein